MADREGTGETTGRGQEHDPISEPCGFQLAPWEAREAWGLMEQRQGSPPEPHIAHSCAVS